MITKVLDYFKKDKKADDIEVDNPNQVKNMTYDEAKEFLQKEFIDSEMYDMENLQRIQSFAMSGDKESKETIIDGLLDVIKKNNVEVESYTSKSLANEVFAEKYGLGILEKYYIDPTIDEIRVNGPDNIRIVRRGIPYKIPESYDSEEQIERAIKRLIMEDVSSSLDKSNPSIESILKDGSRLTANCYPVSDSWNFILRKHDSFEPTIENYKEVGTLNEFVWDRLSVLARGNSKILFSGNVGSGKTTLSKKVIGELDDNLRIGVIGKNSEMKLKDMYPDRDIIELQEQPKLGVSMKELFNTMLRESVDCLVVEEFRGSGEAIEAVRACGRGLPSAMSTAHFNNAEEAIEGVGLLLIEEGLNLTLDLAKLRVARAFNVVVQLFGDSITGKKKLISISEVSVSKKGEIQINDIVRWSPETDDYFGEGEWVQLNQPSDDMLKNILVNVDREEVESLGWDTSRV